MWKIITLFAVGLLLLTSELQAATEADAQAKPNIIFIVLDDIGQMDISLYNKQAPATPNIDAIAKRGVYFTNAFLSTSYCSASRAALITGMNPSVAGAPNLHDPIPEGVKTLPYFLKQQGYHNVAVGKWHMGEPSKKFFDEIIPSREDSGAADWVNTLKKRPKQQPFFFWLAPNDGHLDYTGWHPPYLRFDKEGRLLRPWLKKPWLNLWRYTVKLNDYFFEVRRIDRYIGQLFAELERDGILDKTFIVILSDNGPQQEAKGSLYDRGLLTPLIIHYPPLTDFADKSELEQLVSTLDVTPTLTDIAGAGTPEQMQGYSLLPLLKGQPDIARQWIYAEKGKYEIDDYQRVIRTARYSYKRNYWNRNFCGNTQDYAVRSDLRSIDLYSYEELYDVKQDPLQQVNIIDSAPKVLVNELRATMNVAVRRNKGAQPIPPLFFSNCRQLLLESLGIFLFDVEASNNWMLSPWDDKKINRRL